jgi:hypothetical protein
VKKQTPFEMNKKKIKTYQLTKNDCEEEDLIVVAKINHAKIVWKDESKPSVDVRNINTKKKFEIFQEACLENATLVWKENI